ncbi:hypothetical protein PQJ75_05310 [Rhodoplanes sp. TEM]|uniref:Uncharacterized protein n=1 Tax=Rhodoplanes tepidamans TaxID=200616 RepID=A0ABT5JA79_RHOTP|nr:MULTISPECIES: hypothetical protein [Rhodoplanes]MDC7786521.1 hypothetical protein [Rhodoplanes tepidamans]MDC7983141.1 hypothetical protein [Rhodoplanes sp. TEM]MDQ0357599.1 hypothetical protein [Rhodoplanes tepidamans]
MVPARRLAAAATAASVVAVACSGLAVSGTGVSAQGAPACEEAAGIAVLPSPVTPWKGAPLRVLFTAEKPLQGELTLVAPNGAVAARTRARMGGPPYFWLAEVTQPAAGTWRATLVRDDASSECATVTREIAVKATQPPRPKTQAGSVWPVRASWSRANENFYAAWVEKLFDSPLDAPPPSWKALHEVLRDRSRNLLFDHLGLAEDQAGLVIRPDCADLPYFLRAYFAFKMGLPYGYAKCTRGGGGQPPRCPAWWNIQKEEPRAAPPPEELVASADPAVPPSSPGLFGFLGQQQRTAAPEPPVPAAAAAKPAAKPWSPPPRPAGLVPGFGHYLKWSIGDGVHSGSGRTALADDNTDYYPVALSQETLRPGTLYADPYGHLLVIAKRVPQTADSAGILLAVDAQPDGTVAIKRFWRGNFLFADDPALGGPGFKRFRPVVAENGGMRRLTNREIARNPNYGDVSLDQAKMSVEAFYDRMEDVISPSQLDPMRAMKEVIQALDEQVRARITSVENGRKYQITGRTAEMPDGAAIFETTGAWEDFATPSRDLRLLIAIDVVRGFPDRVERRPERYAMPAGQSVAAVKAELESVLAAELSSRKFSYPRTDGSPWTLTVKDVVDRVKALEMAYNVNDCVELRWGAPDGSAEAATCKGRASSSQRSKMADYRAWFAERRRPPRG